MKRHMISLSAPSESEGGFSLLEVLAATIILAITILGAAMLLNRGYASVVGVSDQRAALYLADQMIEQQIAQLRSPSVIPTRQASGLDIANVCIYTIANPNNCNGFPGTQYSLTETLAASASGGWSNTQAAAPLRYTRSTCIQWVSDSTLQHATDGTPAADCPCTNGGTQDLTHNAKRICVEVTQIDSGGRSNARVPVVVVRAVLASPP